MKKIIFFATALLGASVFYSFILLERAANDVLKQLGIAESAANDHIWGSFSGGYFSYPYSQTLKKTPIADRGRLVREIGEYAKGYTHSEDFKNRYRQYREDMKPQPPEVPQSGDDMKKEQKADMEKSIKEMEAMIKQMPADQQESMKEAVKAMKEQLKTLDDPNNLMNNPEMDKMRQQGHEQEMAEYWEALKEWEKKYPLAPDAIIRQRLKEFLEISKDIDFNAKLVKNQYGKMIFENSAYERKDGRWKMCFRSGKESVTAAREFAQQWLNEAH